MPNTADSSSFTWRGFKSRALPEVSPWVETLGRFGHLAKGIVYFIIGFLAFKLAIGSGGQLAGSREAIREIGRQPYGRILLGLVAIGLLGYTLWRLVQAIKDTEGEGSDAQGVFKRIGFAISGIIYLGLGGYAGAVAVGLAGQWSGSGGGNSASPLLGTMWGRAILAVVGVIVIGVGLHAIYKGYEGKFMEKYNLASMSQRFRQFAFQMGRAGLITRGIAVVIIGAFLCSSAIQGTSDGEISGMQDALAAIAAQPYGKFLLAATGFGLMCYAAHMCLLGWCRQFNVNRA